MHFRHLKQNLFMRRGAENIPPEQRGL